MDDNTSLSRGPIQRSTDGGSDGMSPARRTAKLPYFVGVGAVPLFQTGAGGRLIFPIVWNFFATFSWWRDKGLLQPSLPNCPKSLSEPRP